MSDVPLTAVIRAHLEANGWKVHKGGLPDEVCRALYARRAKSCHGFVNPYDQSGEDGMEILIIDDTARPVFIKKRNYGQYGGGVECEVADPKFLEWLVS